MSNAQASRGGLTLIETMIGLAVVATGLMVAFGHIAVLRNAQDSTEARQLRTIAVRNIANLYAGAGVDEISAWHAPGSNQGMPQLDDNAYATVENLVSRNMLASSSGFIDDTQGALQARHLRFGIGFYRILDNQDAPGQGFWGAQSSSSLQTSVGVLDDRGRSLADNRTRRQPWRVTDPNDDSQVDPKMPVAVLVVCYLDDGRPRTLESVTSVVARR